MLSSNQPGRHDAAGCGRRGVLRGAVGAVIAVAVPGVLAGCELPGRTPEPDPQPDPLASLLTATLELAGQYDEAIRTVAELGTVLAPIAATHRTHAEELGRIVGVAPPTATDGPTRDGSDRAGTSGPPTPATNLPPADPRATVAALRAAEETAGAAAAEACRSAPAERAALLGSIAAARACHLEVLP
ncbi:hypothetical protein [Micromonospora sp. LOL_023]|uniref:hypothetical protein n=1 Tax=Micromonospora sp. LOL_023 TaxID=3345418 RepID=UPI003A84D1E0